MRKSKWLIYTVVVGALPFLIRLLLYVISKRVQADYIINEIDMITFGLVLNITNINELEDDNEMSQQSKFNYKGISIVAIVLFAVFLGIAYVADMQKDSFLDKSNIKICSAILSLLSLGFSYSIYNGQNTQQND